MKTKTKVRLAFEYEIELDASIVSEEVLQQASEAAFAEFGDHFRPSYSDAALFIGMKVAEGEVAEVREVFGDAYRGVTITEIHYSGQVIYSDVVLQ